MFRTYSSRAYVQVSVTTNSKYFKQEKKEKKRKKKKKKNNIPILSKKWKGSTFLQNGQNEYMGANSYLIQEIKG